MKRPPVVDSEAHDDRSWLEDATVTMEGAYSSHKAPLDGVVPLSEPIRLSKIEGVKVGRDVPVRILRSKYTPTKLDLISRFIADVEMQWHLRFPERHEEIQAGRGKKY